MSFMMRAKLYLKTSDGRVLDAPGEIVPLCTSSFINDQISELGNGLSESNPVTLPETVGKNSLDVLLLYFQNHVQDETLHDDERYRLDEELLYGMNVIRVCELHAAACSLGIPPLVDICKAALDRIKAAGTASVPPLPPLTRVYPKPPVIDEEDDDQRSKDSRTHNSSRTTNRTAFATASLTGLLNIGGNNNAEHRSRLQTLLQARRKEEEGCDKKTAVASGQPKDVDKKQEDTRTMDELLSFIGVSESEGKKAKQPQPAPKKKAKAKGQTKGKERPWAGSDSGSGSEKETDVRQEAPGAISQTSLKQTPSQQEMQLSKEEVSAAPSFSSEIDQMEQTESSPEISPISNEDTQPSASIFREQLLAPILSYPILSYKTHLPMNNFGSSLLPIIPPRTLPFAVGNKPRARLSALPQLEPE